MTVRGRSAGLLVAVCVALALWRLFAPQAGTPPTDQHSPAPPPDLILPQAVEQGGLTVVRGSDFDTRYGTPSSSAAEDLEMLRETLAAAFLLVKNFRELPLADNADFTAFLAGKNPHQVAWVRPGHPLVNASGELLDRWGEPVFFHRESSSRTSLRSAGPDRTLWTQDDLVLDDLP
jgi:hypothetical protein